MKSTFTSGGVIAASAISYHISGVLFHASDYAEDARMPCHAHEYAHFVFHVSGKVTQICRRHAHQCESGSLIFLPMGEPHSTHFHEGVRTFQIVMEPQWVERIQQSSALLDTPLEYENSLPIWLAMRIYREFQHRDNLAPLMLEGLLLELLAVMSRHTTHTAESRLPHWLKQARDLLHDRFTENLSPDAIAAAVGVHPSHLMNGFRQHYHCTIGDYVRRLRVEYAAHLLSTSEMPASQIAHTAGFADQSHFCHTFKQLTKMTPTQFLQASRSNPSLRQEILP